MSTLYTPEQRLDAFERAADVTKVVRENSRMDKVLVGLKAIVSDDDFVVVPKITVTAGEKIFHVTSDPMVRTSTDMINKLDCPVKWGAAENPTKIPTIIQPVDCKVRLAPLGQVMTTEQIYNLPRIVTPAQYFAFGAKFPEEQLEGPIVTVWLADGRFWYAILNRCGRGRGVDVGQVRPGYEWRDRYRVLLCE
jgi:hypothetical protein